MKDTKALIVLCREMELEFVKNGKKRKDSSPYNMFKFMFTWKFRSKNKNLDSN
jgi:hypothetical protein